MHTFLVQYYIQIQSQHISGIFFLHSMQYQFPKRQPHNQIKQLTSLFFLVKTLWDLSGVRTFSAAVRVLLNVLAPMLRDACFVKVCATALVAVINVMMAQQRLLLKGRFGRCNSLCRCSVLNYFPASDPTDGARRHRAYSFVRSLARSSFGADIDSLEQ